MPCVSPLEAYLIVLTFKEIHSLSNVPPRICTAYSNICKIRSTELGVKRPEVYYRLKTKVYDLRQLIHFRNSASVLPMR
jgi:hypothetical protein